MSVEAMTWAMRQRAVASSTDRHVLLVLANCADNEGGSIFPSLAWIEEATGYSRRTVQEARRRLTDGGVLVEVEGAKRSTKEYRIPAVAEAMQQLRGGVEEMHPGGAGDARGGAAAAPGTVSNTSGSEEDEKDSPPETPKRTPLERVWDEYVRVMVPRRKELDAEAKKIIREALQVASEEECKAAIRGCRASAWHMGQNPQGKPYKRISNILRGKKGRDGRADRTTREQIDMFLDVAEKAGGASGVSSADPAMVSQAKRAVLDAGEFPDDAQVQERGERAEAWLREQGWLVERDDGGKPRFLPQMDLGDGGASS